MDMNLNILSLLILFFFSVMNNLLYICYAIGNTWLIHNEFQGVIQVLCDTGVLP